MNTNETPEPPTNFSEQDLNIAALLKRKNELQKPNSLKNIGIILFIITLLGFLGSILILSLDDEYAFSEYGSIYSKVTDSIRNKNIIVFGGEYYKLVSYPGTLTKDTLYEVPNNGKLDTAVKYDETNLVKNVRHHFEDEYKTQKYWNIFYSTIGALLFGIFIMWISGIANRYELKQIQIKLLKAGAQELKENIETDFFTKLVEINFKYIDQYYLQTQQQADKSFVLAVVAASIGFIVILSGVIMMFTNSKNMQPASLTTGAGIISEFIAAVFFYLYNKTILKMSEYHQKLVITQNISLALKTADTLQNSKEETLAKIVESLTTDVNKHLTSSNSN